MRSKQQSILILLLACLGLRLCVAGQQTTCKERAPILDDELMLFSIVQSKGNATQTLGGKSDDADTVLEAHDVGSAQAVNKTACYPPKCKARIFEHGRCTGRSWVISDGSWNFDATFNDMVTSFYWEKHDARCVVDFYPDGWLVGSRWSSTHPGDMRDVGNGCWQFFDAGNDRASSALVTAQSMWWNERDWDWTKSCLGCPEHCSEKETSQARKRYQDTLCKTNCN
eukprot:TRINITY_DN1226_c0_g1_i2.p1 TRINITY_DN1226_c0_g1~~TRINITY_DN1226_c0_g1_i2.p1  ORF type:complete len:226 (+),score=23.55 TRINITY_DN1226_c0_g1_i2:70-747(+)